MKWQTALTTNPSIARAVGMLLDIIDNCDFLLLVTIRHFKFPFHDFT